MPKRVKFRKPNGPAFEKGELWRSHAGNILAEIVDREQFGEGKFDWIIWYRFPNHPDSPIASKGAWCFQVRYRHTQDRG